MKAAKYKPAPVVNTPPGNRWQWIAGFFVVLILVIQVYSPALNGPFVFDDEYLVLRDPGFLEAGIAYIVRTARPLMNLSFWLNLKWFGMENTYSYHLANVLFHCVNGALMFLALRKLLEYAGERGWKRDLPAIFSALLFLLHPVQAESVAYISGRSESLSLVWFLGAYTLFLYKRAGGIRWGAAIGVIVLFGAAFLSKEHAAVLPALFLLTDWFFPESESRMETIKANWRLYLPTAVIGALGVAMVSRVLLAASTAGFGMKDLPWHNYFFTQWRALWVYLKLFVLPVNLNADYVFPISRSPLDHGAIWGLLGLLALLAVAFYYRKRFPLAFFGLLVFLLLIAPTSSIVPIRDPVAERRMYLPFIGLLLALCDLIRHSKASQFTQSAALGGVLLMFGVLAHGRAELWGDPIKLWKATIERDPTNYRANFQLAMAYFEHQRCAEAVQQFAVTEKVATKKDFSLYLDWGLAHDCLNQSDRALEKFRQALAIENNGRAHAYVGMELAKQNKNAAAIEALNEAVKLEPGSDLPYVYRGNVYLLMNELDKAEADYRKALAVAPNSEQAQQGLARLGQRKGNAR